MKNPLHTRPTSGFPVSIATGLALETIFEPVQEVYDEARDTPERIKPDTYTDYLINLATIARNLINSLPYKEIATCSKSDVLDTFLEEIEYLNTLFQLHDKSVEFYVHSYAYPRQTYKKTLRVVSTSQQHTLFDMMEYCLSHVKKQDNVHHFTKNIRTHPTSTTLLLTHVPWDLLSYSNFHKLDLLESHTGVVKSRAFFNTKYHKLGKDMSFLPFMEYLLTTFGDGTMFKPAPMEDRLRVYDDMVKRKVHPLMSEFNFM